MRYTPLLGDRPRKNTGNRSTEQRWTQKGAPNEVRQVYRYGCAPGNDSGGGPAVSELGVGKVTGRPIWQREQALGTAGCKEGYF